MALVMCVRMMTRIMIYLGREDLGRWKNTDLERGSSTTSFIPQMDSDGRPSLKQAGRRRRTGNSLSTLLSHQRDGQLKRCTSTSSRLQKTRRIAATYLSYKSILQHPPNRNNRQTSSFDNGQLHENDTGKWSKPGRCSRACEVAVLSDRINCLEESWVLESVQVMDC